MEAAELPTTAASRVQPMAAAMACPAVMVSQETRLSLPSRCSTTTRIESDTCSPYCFRIEEGRKLLFRRRLPNQSRQHATQRTSITAKKLAKNPIGGDGIEAWSSSLNLKLPAIIMRPAVTTSAPIIKAPTRPDVFLGTQPFDPKPGPLLCPRFGRGLSVRHIAPRSCSFISTT